jgi:uncharacterized protein
MPLLESSTYTAPRGLGGGHLQTLYPALFRRLPHLTRIAERLELSDGDFLDLEWTENRFPRLAILSHGLEGSSRAAYIQGMAAALFRRGWDVLAWNLRGCGGQTNRLPRFYHSGASDDLAAVVAHAIATHRYQRISLVGFSLGGNLVLKFLGEQAHQLPPLVRAAAAISVPCDLACSAERLASPANALYMRRFLRDLHAKIHAKARHFPDQINPSLLRGIRDFHGFDEHFTAPLHGFLNARDYWTRSSCRPFLPRITIPVLLINALNDPFLGPACYPREEATDSPNLFLETPAQGGHVGFPTFGAQGEYWSEQRTAEFILHHAGPTATAAGNPASCA